MAKKEAEKWLQEGGKYIPREKADLMPGIYFDAGTGRGKGVEVSVTSETGKDLLGEIISKELINAHGKHLLSKEKTNNYNNKFIILKRK